MTEATTRKIVLGQSSYGKSDIRLVKVKRDTSRHEITDVRVNVALTGDFEAAYIEGDNTGLLATDTMRNTVYALAKDHLTGEVEDFGIKLVEHFLKAGPKVEHVRIRFVENLWDRIIVDGEAVEAGLDDMLMLKTTNSGWEGYLHEQYTTLPETDDRILATVVVASWRYDTADVDFGETWRGVRDRILETFTDHYSPSVQNTLYRMGEAVLEEYPEIQKIHFSLPNRHHIPYDLGRFGMKNEGEIFHTSPEPYG